MRALLIALIGVLFTMNAYAENEATAVFAGGCFWCMEAELQEVEGVKAVTSGYTGGHTKDPTYHETGTGATGHAEAVEVVYDPSVVSYEKLLEVFWDNIDPTDASGQFYDRGSQYRTAIFYHTDEEKAFAEASKAERQKRLNQPIVTEIVKVSTFYPAESYHQDYYKTNSTHYNAYKSGSRRKETLKKIWKQ